MDEAIKKARRAFFAFGAMGGFQGKLNPISTRCIFETCVVPVLLYGCENWILTDSLLHKLEMFQVLSSGIDVFLLYCSGSSPHQAAESTCAAAKLRSKR